MNTSTFMPEVVMTDSFEELKSTLSINLKMCRARVGLSQERLALESGVDRTVVSRLERCLINPTLQILLKLAVRLEVPVHELLMDRDKQNS